MQSTLSMKDADPHDIFAIEPEITPVARTEKPTIAPDAAAFSAYRDSGQLEPHFGPAATMAAPMEPSARTFTLEDLMQENVDHDDLKLTDARPSRLRWAIRAFFFVFAIGSAVAAAAWEHYGDRAKQMVAGWTPNVAPLSSLLTSKSAPAAEQTNAAAVQTAAADQAVRQPEPAAPPQEAAAAAAAPAMTVPAAAPAPEAPALAAAAAAEPAPDQTQLLQSMTHDLASMGQQIEQLKASIDQLKAGQDQLVQRIAKLAEAKPADARPATVNPAPPPRPRASTLAPRAAVTPPPATPRRPVQAYVPAPQSASAAALPPAVAAPAQRMAPPPAQSQPLPATTDLDDEPVVRPPMPLR
ncbi:hypothetical protein [Bradyrhizobium lablabi]|uniref:hypothetical protein n=1 Tax=Bradyrhizobium lablabi TaxID=722472 RepID=UPI001BA57E37|nr:hypothetical protein [Bradyrhizobium lablabi]MBR0692921.1 hypothetical protein [Bradyrhizobium lablabi]